MQTHLTIENQMQREQELLKMTQNDSRTPPYVWEVLYERAITEPDPGLRRLRLQEAEQAILNRAGVLDDNDNEAVQHEPEAQALEEAADFLREMKLITQSDGVAKEMKSGAKVELPRDGSGDDTLRVR
jgi:hypothetical protein